MFQTGLVFLVSDDMRTHVFSLLQTTNSLAILGSKEDIAMGAMKPGQGTCGTIQSLLVISANVPCMYCTDSTIWVCDGSGMDGLHYH